MNGWSGPRNNKLLLGALIVMVINCKFHNMGTVLESHLRVDLMEAIPKNPRQSHARHNASEGLLKIEHGK
eukprot:1291408-Prorocentrum_lima.AAC.1